MCVCRFSHCNAFETNSIEMIFNDRSGKFKNNHQFDDFKVNFNELKTDTQIHTHKRTRGQAQSFSGSFRRNSVHSVYRKATAVTQSLTFNQLDSDRMMDIFRQSARKCDQIVDCFREKDDFREVNFRLTKGDCIEKVQFHSHSE